MNQVTMAAPHLTPDEIQAAVEVLESGNLRQGPMTVRFESALADYVGTKYAYAVSSGTAALHLAFLSVLEPGDEVLVPTFTFFASASAVVLAGGVPVFCDVDPDTFLIDLDHAASRISARTTAICAVYLFGQPFDQQALQDFAGRHGLAVIGDAAQALGSSWNGIPVGKEAMATAHSFYPTKNLFVGEGGMVTTDDPELDEKGRLLRSHGQGPKYHHSIVGLNYRLTDVEAAIGLRQLPLVEPRNQRRRAIAKAYDHALAGLEGLTTPSVIANAVHAFHQYTIRIDPELRERDAFEDDLAKAGVQSQVNYPLPLHRQGAFSLRLGSDRDSLPVAERISAEVLSIPVHHHLTDHDRDQVIEAVTEAAQR